MRDIKVFGIPNCDVTKDAIKWLQKQQIGFQFYNYREVTLDIAVIRRWVEIAGIGKILNKRSKTWKALPEDTRQKQIENEELLYLLQANPTLIKRPLLEINGIILTGFNKDEYLSFIKNS